jgi:hydroxypyruvate reductase
VRAGIRGASASHAIIRALGNPGVRAALTGPLHVFAAGKAAGPMSAALLTDHTLTVRTILAAGPQRPADLPPHVTWFEGSHPFPDERSVAAGRAGLALAARVSADETLVLLLSGGASALAAVPADGITLAEKRRAIEVMMHAGADIHALNTVRKHLSAIKGGRLAGQCRGSTITLAVSDVVGDDVSVIGSGPGVPDPTTWGDAAQALAQFGNGDHPATVRTTIAAGVAGALADTPKPGAPELTRTSAYVIATQRDALRDAASEARARGFETTVVPAAVTGEARVAAAEWLRDRSDLLRNARQGPICAISAGETTVRVTGSGRGGRNQEFALALVDALAAVDLDLIVTSIGTDGIDGPTDAAGAVAESSTQARARARGLSPAASLEQNDSYSFFAALGDLIHTGRTDTNVGDLQILLARPR